MKEKSKNRTKHRVWLKCRAANEIWTHQKCEKEERSSEYLRERSHGRSDLVIAREQAASGDRALLAPRHHRLLRFLCNTIVDECSFRIMDRNPRSRSARFPLASLPQTEPPDNSWASLPVSPGFFFFLAAHPYPIYCDL